MAKKIESIKHLKDKRAHIPSQEDANIDNIKNELADVFYTAFLIADKYRFDIKELIIDKIKINELKYPVHKSKGSN